LLAAAKAAADALQRLNLPLEETPTNEAEIELRMPDSLVKGSLGGLGKQAGKLDRIIGDIGEAATGSRPTIKLGSLGSGSVDITVVVDPVTGAQVLTFVTAIVTLINALLTTKAKRKALEEENAPPEIVERLIAWERQRADARIDELRKEMIEHAATTKATKPRVQELDTALRRSLPQLAREIEDGLDVDVTIREPHPEDVESAGAPTEPVAPAEAEARRMIEANTGAILQLKRGPEPVLLLKAGDEDEDDEASAPTADDAPPKPAKKK
jgi:hypothetical protein